MTTDFLDLIARIDLPNGKRVPYSEARYGEIMDFLIDEARCLDQNRFADWQSMLSEDLVYVAPVRRNRLRKDGDDIDPLVGHFNDNFVSICSRIRRLSGDNGFSEDPPSRTRRNVTNVIVHETEVDGEFAVISNISVFRNRGDALSYDIISAVRYDLLRTIDGSLKLAQRVIVIDQVALGTPNLAIFL